ncbi:PMEI domain-containing protein [Citrus sinensis]|uniref:PMEI domain-containing protein n=2 Tax=Citrus sinensis TaxID=2711 RepID=A0ACB8LRP9_CITSI|nr:PMEI domain-containing protein [Citrus sinensis]KDO76093.1 hypothetical protein CISIN_1g026791mg [Citrus sinensis]
MDAINVMKGYDKVDHLQNRAGIHSLRTHQRLKTAVTISAIVLLTLIIGLMLAVLIRESNAEEQQRLDAAESIKTVCSVTQNPDSCFTALSSSLNISSTTTKPDPEVILKLSLQVNVNHFSNITSSIKSLYGNHLEVALRDCVDQLRDASSRLNDSMSELNATLTDRTVNDIQTWISAAMTDEETCLDGLEEMGSTVADEVKTMMKKSKELLSYSLAIIANIRTLLQKFGLHMH